MRVSVLIPHHGEPSPTRALVAALVAQHPRPPHEIIVVDDHSPQPLGNLAGATCLRNPENRGFGRTVNAAARRATGDALLILNTDVTIGPTFVADLAAAAEPFWPAVLGPRVVDREGRIDWTARQFPRAHHQAIEWFHPVGRWLDRPTVRAAIGSDPRSVGRGTFATGWLVGAALLLPRAAFDAVGGFDARFYMNSEEVDLQRRLRQRGLPAIYLGGVEMVHEGGASTPSARRRSWVMEGRTRYARKWGGLSAMRVGLTAASAGNLGVESARWLAGRPTTPVRRLREELDLIWGTW